MDTEYRIDADQALHWYDEEASGIKQLLERKKITITGEAWRDMRIASMIWIWILMKLLRIKEIEDNAGFTPISRSLDANYQISLITLSFVWSSKETIYDTFKPVLIITGVALGNDALAGIGS